MSSRRLGHYEVLDKLGQGGMGEVFRARDTDLDREVALKFLPPALVQDPEHLTRFEREAKLLASLNHPNIAVVYGLHRGEDDTRFLAMELVPGKNLHNTLADSGPMAPGEAVDVACQIAEGLAAAHDQGVIHRDLKPSNVMLTLEGRAKILDFGLAKSVATDASRSSATLSHSPTMTSPATMQGVILGTVAYMAPEQARGKPVDRRADIWAFGCVLYEMLTGRTAFQGDTVTDIVAAIIHKEPDYAEIPGNVPAGVVHVMQRCLRKNAAERYRDAGDLALLLREAMEAPERETPAAPPAAPSRALAWWRAAALALLVVLIGWQAYARFAAPKRTVSAPKLVDLERLTDLPGEQGDSDLSFDGRSVVYASVPAGEPPDNADIFLLRVGGENPIDLTPNSKAQDVQPAFSPDGEQIAYAVDGDPPGLYVMGATGESPRRVAESGYDPDWSSDGRHLAYTTVHAAPLSRSAKGTLHVLDLETGEDRALTADGFDAVDPDWSPDRRFIAVTNAWSGAQGQRDLWIVPADGGAPVQITDDVDSDWGPVWSPDGRWLYFISDRFGGTNVWRLPVTGGAPGGEPQRVSSSVVAIYRVALGGDGTRLVLETHETKTEQMMAGFDPNTLEVLSPFATLPAGSQSTQADPSPDGARVAYRAESEDLFVLDRATGMRRRIVGGDARNRGPAWSPDGNWIAFYSNRSGAYEIWAVRSDGTDLTQLTTEGGNLTTPRWTPLGLYTNAGTGAGLHVVELEIGDWGRNGLHGPVKTRSISDTGEIHFNIFADSPKGTRFAGRIITEDGRRQDGILDMGTLRMTPLREISEHAANSGFTWLDEDRFLMWSPILSRAIVGDMRTGSEIEVPGVPGPGDYAFVPGVNLLHVTRLTTEGDLWLLRVAAED